MKPLNRDIVLKSYIENKEWLSRRNAEGIERYRKGNFSLKFPTNSKKALKIRHKKHAFLFGCTAFMLDSFETPEKESEFKRLFANLFNQAIVPFYWSDLEPEEGKPRFSKESPKIYRRPAPNVCLAFCEEYGIEPKGHCLLWNNFLPKWFLEKNEAQKRTAIERRFAEIAERYADKIPSFDIVNESASNYRRGKMNIFEDYDKFGQYLGAKYFPNNRKILNETNEAIWHSYYKQGKYMPFHMQLQEFIREGVPFDEIGLQYHIFHAAEMNMETPSVNEPFLNARHMVEILELYDAYGYPMHISEITVPSYAGKLPENEAIQAELVEALYKTWFATRNMKSIVWWNLIDGYAAYAPLGSEEGENRYAGGLCHFDMSKKPAYEVLDRLINHEWRTNIDSECKEEFAFRGFFGEYEIEVEDENGKTIYTVNFENDGMQITL